MNDETNVEKIVMRRVRRISLLRILISGGIFALALALLALYGIGREVWVAMIFRNGPQDFFGHTLYLVYAFEHTRLVVQGLILVCLISLIYLAREIARLLTQNF